MSVIKLILSLLHIQLSEIRPAQIEMQPVIMVNKTVFGAKRTMIFVIFYPPRCTYMYDLKPDRVVTCHSFYFAY